MWNALIPWNLLQDDWFLVSILLQERKQSLDIISNKNNTILVDKTLLVVYDLFVISERNFVINTQTVLVVLWVCQWGKTLYAICLHRFKALLIMEVVQQTEQVKTDGCSWPSYSQTSSIAILRCHSYCFWPTLLKRNHLQLHLVFGDG